MPEEVGQVTGEERFEHLVDELQEVSGVTPPSQGRGFGSTSLRYHNKIFAMLVDDRLVVKLPRGRVDDLVDAGMGDRFDANKGVPMKEWLRVGPSSSVSWSGIAREALEFARTR